MTPDRKPHHQKDEFRETYTAETEVDRGQCVMPGTDETECVPSTANANNLGIAMNSVTTEQITAYEAGTGGVGKNAVQVMVQMHGIAPVLAGAAIAFGEFVKSDANGRVIPVDGAAANPEYIIGKCLHATAADGDPTHIFLTLMPSYNTAVQA